jgi:hypothetical protein
VSLSGRTRIAGIAVAAVIAWAAWDLYAPPSHNLRDFQPDEVGRLETRDSPDWGAHSAMLLPWVPR